MAPKQKKIGKEEQSAMEEPELQGAAEVLALLDNMKKELKSTKSNKVEKLPEMLLGLTAAVQILVEKLKDIPDRAKERERLLEDEIDEVRQRSLKGNLIISTTKTSNAIPPEEQLLAQGRTATDQALDLLKDKLDVSVPRGDVQDCHYLPGGNLIIRIWNVAPKSAFRCIVDKIKSGKGNKEVPIYVNFHLTKRRSSILFHLRTLKREGKIAKFYSDEGGAIAIRVKEGSNKIRLTNFPVEKNKPGSPLRTVRDREEILAIAGLENGSNSRRASW